MLEGVFFTPVWCEWISNS